MDWCMDEWMKEILDRHELRAIFPCDSNGPVSNLFRIILDERIPLASENKEEEQLINLGKKKNW